ncbi:MAG: DUF5716 family protein [Clostridiales bacterium]|jgi:molecular chaperone DnaK (HSP70)|nr:DUF5716 family protein [Clostridiales bacterium]
MSWKKNKLLFAENYPDESQFIIGIDIGNSMSSIAYFDVNLKMPQIIDISGGYGKQNLPSAIQYASDDKEWIFGEYALFNNASGSDIKITSIMDKLGKKEYYYINNKPFSLSHIVGLYIKELINNCKSLNPKANIAGIVASIPAYIDESALNELKTAFANSGYEKYVIDYIPNRECILTRYFYKKAVDAQRVYIIDFGSKQLRAAVYDLKNEFGEVKTECISSMYEPELGEKNIEGLIRELVLGHLAKNNKQPEGLTQYEQDQLQSFIYNYKDLIFQKNASGKPVKLYYNFIHPPFRYTLEKEDIDNLIAGFQQRFKEFLLKAIEKTITSKKLKLSEIDRVICTGGGFEMFWPQKLVNNLFGEGKTVFFKNAKGVTSEGASIIAATKLGVIKNPKFVIKDKNLITDDIGIKVSTNKQEKFYTLIERDSFWWNAEALLSVILNDNKYCLEVYKRNSDFETKILGRVSLDKLVRRPKGASKVKLGMRFEKPDELLVEIEDLGFGELFPRTGYKQKFNIPL